MKERLAVAFHLSDLEVITVICPFCKKEIPDHAHFCPECGQNVTSVESTSGASATYLNSVEKEAECDNKILIDAENKLFDFEEKLCFLKEKLERQEIIEKIIEMTNDEKTAQELQKLL